MGLHILVLAGGSGTRLWPLSRRSTPKHLLPLAPGGETLLRATLERVTGLGDSVRIVTAADQADGCRAALDGARRSIGDAIIAEPQARGTGPALGLAVALIARDDPDALIASVHADHRVSDPRCVSRRRAGLGRLGGRHRRPGDGRARPGGARSPGSGTSSSARHGPARCGGRPAGALRGSSPRTRPRCRRSPGCGFKEKPSAEIARRYLEDGRHLWNLGLFAWTARRFLAELGAADPELGAALERGGRRVAPRRSRRGHPALRGAATAGGRTTRPRAHASGSRSSQASFGWSDLGSWSDVRDARVGGRRRRPRRQRASKATWSSTSARDCTVISRSGTDRRRRRRRRPRRRGHAGRRARRPRDSVATGQGGRRAAPSDPAATRSSDLCAPRT